MIIWFQLVAINKRIKIPVKNDQMFVCVKYDLSFTLLIIRIKIEDLSKERLYQRNKS